MTVLLVASAIGSDCSPTDLVTAQIERHIHRITKMYGEVGHYTVNHVCTTVDPTTTGEWIPPPWFDSRKIKDPKLREEWMQSDKKEFDGLLLDRQCAREELLDDVLKANPNEEIIGSLTQRKRKRNGQANTGQATSLVTR